MSDKNNASTGRNMRKRSAPYGFPVHDLKQAKEEALSHAEALVQEVRGAGKTLRVWSERTVSEMGTFLKNHLQTGPLEDLQHAPWANREAVLLNIVHWEKIISQAIHRYMRETAATITDIQLLNPPLKSEHIEPFIHAILEDRRGTFTALQPLSRLVEKLLTLKYRLNIDSAGRVRHQP